MPLVLGCLALAFPRVVLFLVWLLGGSYLSSVYPNILFLLLGFLFLPLTTLAFAFASHSLAVAGGLSALGWLVTGLAVLLDIGIVGHNHRSYRSRRIDD
jgi:hypothetical protein